MKNMEQLNDQAMENVSGGISEQEAMAAALKHAGLTESQVSYQKRIIKDFERGRKVYQIQFYGVDGFEYEFDVDAMDGRILEFSKDFDD